MRHFCIAIILCLLSFSPAHALRVQLTSSSQNIAADEVVVALIPQNEAYNFQLDLSPQDVAQKEYRFEPRITVVQKGQSIVFPNRDSTHHNVYSFSKTKRFDFRLYIGQGESVVLDKEGVVTVGCNIHDWMLAYIVVVDTPFFSISDKTGLIDFNEIPPGQYEVKIWHPGLRENEGLKSLGMLDVPENQEGQVVKVNVPEGFKHTWPRKPTYIQKTY